LEMTLGGGGRVGNPALSTPVDNSVCNLWGTPPGAVDERGNRV
jgi:hypothetical protein